MMTTPQARWWRWLAPGNFLTALLVFCLPWIEVRCDKSAVQPRLQAPGDQRAAIAPSQRPDWEIVVTQSGLQAVHGGYSIAPAASRESARQRREALDIPAAPLIGAYAGLLVLAAATGIVMRNFRHRRLTGLAQGAAAFLILLVQGLVGFPIEAKFRKEAEPSPPNRQFIDVRYTSWYYLSFALLLGGMAASALDRPLYRRPLDCYERENVEKM